MLHFSSTWPPLHEFRLNFAEFCTDAMVTSAFVVEKLLIGSFVVEELLIGLGEATETQPESARGCAVR